MTFMTVLIIFIFGLCIGSFLNCLVWRLNQKKTISGRSICPKCKQKISWYDNIPLLSFIILGGKCRHCRKSISWQYPIVELVTGILFVLVALVSFQFPVSQFLSFSVSSLQLSIPTIVKFFRNLTFVSVLITIFVYDLRWYLILDKVTMPAMVVALFINLYLGFSFFNLLLATVISGGFFLLQFLISKGKWIGGGDIRLGALMGLMLGFPNILVALMIAYILGSIVGIGLILNKKKKWQSQIPFGTFLSMATVIALLWGEQIMHWYLSISLY